MKLSIKLMLMLVLTAGIMFSTACKKDEGPKNKPTVKTLDFTAKANGTADGSGEVTDDGGAEITSRGVVYGSLEDPVIGDTGTKTVSAGSGTGKFDVHLSQLAPKFTYHVRAYATNSEGTSYGADVEFTVL